MSKRFFDDECNRQQKWVDCTRLGSNWWFCIKCGFFTACEWSQWQSRLQPCFGVLTVEILSTALLLSRSLPSNHLPEMGMTLQPISSKRGNVEIPVSDGHDISAFVIYMNSKLGLLRLDKLRSHVWETSPHHKNLLLTRMGYDDL